MKRMTVTFHRSCDATMELLLVERIAGAIGCCYGFLVLGSRGSMHPQLASIIYGDLAEKLAQLTRGRKMIAFVKPVTGGFDVTISFRNGKEIIHVNKQLQGSASIRVPVEVRFICNLDGTFVGKHTYSTGKEVATFTVRAMEK